MVEAVRTTASPAAIWAICIVAVACLAFWLGMVSYADRHPYVRNRRLPEMPGPVLGGYHVAEGGRSVAPNREAPAERGDLFADLAAQAPTAGHPGEAETGRPQVPAQRGPRAPAEPTAPPSPTGAGARPEPVPAQRTAPGDTPAEDVMPGDASAEAPTEPIPAQRSDAGAEGAGPASDHPAGSGAGGRG